MRSLVRLLALSLACAACTPPVPGASSAIDAPAAPTVTPESPKTPLPLPDELKGLAKGNNAFALDLFAKARAEKGNLSFSPLSIWTALTMTWAGARGETAAQMQKVLHLDGTAPQMLDLDGKLLASYQDPARKVALRIANRLFGEKTYSFDPAYLDRSRGAFGAPLEPLDFQHAAEASRQHINAWVAEATLDRIKDLLPRGGVDATTRLVLTNTLYFLGDWGQPFTRELTTAARFRLTAERSEDVPTMHQVRESRFAATDGVKLLEMLYQGGGFSMMLVLPEKVDGLDAVEARLSPATLDAWLGALAVDRVDVALPKLEIALQRSLLLGEMLKGLGMPLAFDPDRADFTGMASPAADRLYLQQVFHKAFVKLDEKGTEAAAATAVVAVHRGGFARAQPKVEFHADHPFLFFLRDLRSGMILFMGRVSDPTAR